MYQKLTSLGWDEFFSSQLDDENNKTFQPARVIAENKTNYNVTNASGEYIAEVTGKILFNASADRDLPKVGDWVLISITDVGRAIIHQVLERKSALSRKVAGRRTDEQVIATNLDVLFVVQSLDQNFNISRVERYTASLSKGITPVVVFNKADLCTNLEEKLTEMKRRLPHMKFVVVSAVAADVAALREHLKPRLTYAFVGSSGVGKSTLINKLIGGDDLKTGEVRLVDSKGKHTTTRRQMVVLPDGALLIDTPGMREFQPFADDDNVSQAFTDIELLGKSCRYSNCKHVHEDGCAVKAAIAAGTLAPEHFENYQRVKREMDYYETRDDVFAALKKKNEWKRIHKAMRKMNRNKGEDF